MITANLTLGSDVFNHVGNDLVQSKRARAGDSEGVDRVLTVSHGQAKINGLQSDRHLIRVDHTILTEDGVEVTMSAYVVIVKPRHASATDVVVKELVANLNTFTTASSGAYLTQVLNNET